MNGEKVTVDLSGGVVVLPLPEYREMLRWQEVLSNAQPEIKITEPYFWHGVAYVSVEIKLDSYRDMINKTLDDWLATHPEWKKKDFSVSEFIGGLEPTEAYASKIKAEFEAEEAKKQAEAQKADSDGN